MASNVKISGIDINALSDAQKNEIAKIFGISADDIKIAPPKVSTVNHLQMKDGSDTIAIDRYNQKEFDITLLTEEELNNAKQTGLSPETYNLMQIGMEIKKSAAKTMTRGPRTGISAGSQARNIIAAFVNKITPDIMDKLIDKDYNKKMSLSYPLFVEIPNEADDAVRKEIRYDKKNHPRYSNTVYTFPNVPGRSFYMTNNIFSNNVKKIEDILTILCDKDAQEKVSK